MLGYRSTKSPGRQVRRPGSPIAGLKLRVMMILARFQACQKAWKPDCGIETMEYVRKTSMTTIVRRPGSPIAGLKHYESAFPAGRQRVRKPGSPVQGLKKQEFALRP